MGFVFLKSISFLEKRLRWDVARFEEKYISFQTVSNLGWVFG
jgi:hypothetical protein